MNTFKLYNRLLGWVVFLIAAYTYISTSEPSTSLWDCGEFIASAYKLQVGHPPGAPFFMILTRIFTLFAGDNVENVAFMVNSLSAIASAFTILFLFWSITHLAHKITGKEDLKKHQLVAVLGSGLVGALAYTWSDTFWFSAVEGEVYALSSFFTAVVFWAILKWENVAGKPYSNRWLILIAYLMGLSIGVHLLNLLAIPAIALVYYFRMYESTRKGLIIALIISAALLGGVMYGIIPGVVWLAGIFERIFVNGFGMPYNSGVLIYAILLFAGLIFGIRYTHKNNHAIMNTILLGVTVIIIGYSSYTMIVIRSLANPPMDENSPETVFLLQKYLNREQYGDRPLLTGQYFNAQVVDVIQEKPRFTRKDGRYEITSYKHKYEFDDDFTTVFPRMWSSDPNHIKEYLDWGKIDEKDIYNARRNENGQIVMDQYRRPQYDRQSPKDKPTQVQNLRFFFRYQIGHMYMRYFWWNFAGRQNNVQSHGEVLNGNWITGINAIDKHKVGDTNFMPERVKNHKARNKYYLLPFLLGLFGFFFHAYRQQKDYWIVFTLFILTGIAIVIYLNQNPIQPRERDYAYAGSFYAFAIWIGLGVLGIFDLLTQKSKQKLPVAVAVTAACLLLVPGIMAKENWDDHNRAGRYTARDIAYNYLNSCAPNAILFTNGDNDTFPLWYLQEVEGIRTDVRVVNLMLLNMDWYVDQMNRKAYESDRLPITVPRDKYLEGTNDRAYIIERVKEHYNAKELMKWFVSDKEVTKHTSQRGKIDYVPGRKFYLPVDSAAAIENGLVQPEDAHLIEEKVFGTLKGNTLSKSDLIAFDIISNNNWERPIYWVSTQHEALFGMDQYLQLEGLAYRLVPIKSTNANTWEKGRINTNILSENLMEKFRFGGMNDPDVFLDNFHLRTLSIIRLRLRYNRLAERLMEEGKSDEAIEVLDRIIDLTPHEKIPYEMFMPSIVESYFKLGETEKAMAIIDTMYADCIDHLEFYRSFKPKMQENIQRDIMIQISSLRNLAALANRYNQDEFFDKSRERLMEYSQYFNYQF